ncbi:hypothetical protein V495_06574 [Pseudogymnoascus sp. VKM F-4514 (FW-929)]|nr:hypothetical protein V495_06574 [Pseudogymnoascus sp. VKM F-4514 (FW-929)]KFY65721.1 hypothetical protein V497_01312 [Pseudogymnoascus sp. VKM F-4516 (FW-969)]
MSRDPLAHAFYPLQIFKMLYMAASILFSRLGWHSATSVAVLVAAIWYFSISLSDSLGPITAYTVTLFIWAKLLYRLRAYLTPRPSRLPRHNHLRRGSSPPPQKMSSPPYYQLQQPLLCHHETCWAAAAATLPRPKKGPDGLTPFMREQWALAAPGTPTPDMEEVLSTLTVTPAHHYELFVNWATEIWRSIPRMAVLVVSALLHLLVVRPAGSVVKFLGQVDWPRVYLVVGMLVWVWFCGGEKVERTPAPAPRYERVVSYYLVPEVRGWCKFPIR